MTADPPAPKATDTLVRLAGRYLAPRWRSLTLALACAAAFAGLSGWLLGLLQPAVNALTAPTRSGSFFQIPLIIVALALARGAVQTTQALLINRMGNAIVGDIQLELFGKLVRADLGRLRAAHSGAFVSSVLYDAGLIREAATTGLVNIVQQALMLLAAGVVMAWTDWRLAVFVLLAAPVVTVFLRGFMRRATKAARGAMAATSSLATAITVATRASS